MKLALLIPVFCFAQANHSIDGTFSYDYSRARPDHIEVGTLAVCPGNPSVCARVAFTPRVTIQVPTPVPTTMVTGIKYSFPIQANVGDRALVTARAVFADGTSDEAMTPVLTAAFQGAVPPPANPVSIHKLPSDAVLAAPMVLATDPVGGPFLSTATDNMGTATYTFDVPVADSYIVYGRVLAPDDAHDSFSYSMDSGATQIWDEAINLWSTVWQWNLLNGRAGTTVAGTINPAKFVLSAGRHTLKFTGRESGSEVGEIVLTNIPPVSPLSPPPAIVPPPPPVITVTVAPTTATLAAGKTQQFVATVTGSSIGVTWSATLGTISTTGLYTAPATVAAAQTATVRATANADATKIATALVALTPPPPPPPTINCSGTIRIVNGVISGTCQ